MGDPQPGKIIIEPDAAVDAAKNAFGYYKSLNHEANSPGGPRMMLTGVEAAKAASAILAQARTYVYPGTVFGDVKLEPGKVWSGNRVLLDAGPMVVHYMIGETLYEWRTSDFIRTEWLTAMAHGGASASWLARIAKVSFVFALGIFAPWYAMLAITVATSLMVAQYNQKDMEILRVHGAGVVEALLDFRKKIPKTFGVIWRVWLKSWFHNLHEGVHAEDIAFWLGRLIRGFRGFKSAQDITVRAVLGLISLTTFLVALLHAPSIGSGAFGPATEDFVKKLIELAQGQGDSVSREEALACAAEMASDRKEAARLLEKLKNELELVVPATERISKYLEEHAPG